MVELPKTRKGSKIQMTVSLPPDLVRGLKLLSEQTRVPVAAYLSEAVTDLLKKYAAARRKTKGD